VHVFLLEGIGLIQGMRNFWPILIRFGSFSLSLFASKIVVYKPGSP